jgi:hypothetical protein
LSLWERRAWGAGWMQERRVSIMIERSHAERRREDAEILATMTQVLPEKFNQQHVLSPNWSRAKTITR